MINIQNVSKYYGNKLAVNDLSITIAAGELFALLGPNGAGKTTTIKMMCGLLTPSSGTIQMGGYDIQKQGDQARQLISYVPDQPFLYEKLTGREFLRLIAELYGMEKNKIPERIQEMIELFRLSEFVDNLTEKYSHGMRQRTVFAAALVHEPKILIVDEPTVGLDPRSIKLLKDLLRNLAQDGTTICLSTHSLDIAQELADRIGIIDHGRLLTIGTLANLREQASSDGNLEDIFLKLTEEETEENSDKQEATI